MGCCTGSCFLKLLEHLPGSVYELGAELARGDVKLEREFSRLSKGIRCELLGFVVMVSISSVVLAVTLQILLAQALNPTAAYGSRRMNELLLCTPTHDRGTNWTMLRDVLSLACDLCGAAMDAGARWSRGLVW